MTTNRCINGHEVNGPQDRRSNGHCKRCAYDCERRYRTACREARHRLKAIEAALIA